MASESLREFYLRKSREAEVEERKATNRRAQWAWEKIVVSYLELAELLNEHTP